MPLKTMEVMVCNMEIPETPRYQYAREKAIDTLIEYGNGVLPISVKNIIYNLPVNIRYNTFSNLLKSGITMSEILDTYKSNDGAVVQCNNGYCIIYNDINKPSQRIRFTLAHELGHIVLGHLEFDGCLYRLSNNEYKVLETEANQFASQLLSPEPLIRDILKQSKARIIYANQIQNVFDISLESAACVIKRLKSKRGISSYKEGELHTLYSKPLKEIYELYD